MRSCYLWEERLQGATAECTIRSILNAAMTCHGAHGGRTFRNTAWDHMMVCPKRFDAAKPIECLAYALNARADESIAKASQGYPLIRIVVLTVCVSVFN